MSIKVLLYLETAVRNSNSLARNEDNVESREPLLASDSPNGNQYEVLLKMKKVMCYNSFLAITLIHDTILFLRYISLIFYTNSSIICVCIS